MLLAVRFFTINDFILVPLCFVLMYAIVRSRANAADPQISKFYYRAFYFKIICVFAYTLITEFYFGGGDTVLYYQAVKDMMTAIQDDFGYFPDVLLSSHLTLSHPLAPYFLYDNFTEDVLFNYMQGPTNYFVPKVGFLPGLFFFQSYLCICFCLSTFALAGAIRLFKTFYYYYPTKMRELALATLFLPSVGFWSAGFLKDTICYGCVGFIVYGVMNIFIKKRNIASSLFWIVLCSYLVYNIKTYIFLVLVLSLTIWIFAETNKLIKDKTLRRIFAFMTFSIAISAGYFMLQYFTSESTMQRYQLDNIISSAETQRNTYKTLYEEGTVQTSYYSIQTSNPVMLILNSIAATFFRPFPWEIRSVASILSAAEALVFLLLTINLFMKRGLAEPFRLIFRDPRILFCFIFAMVFAVGVGASTANFGTLSRYKIPCMPFYMVMLLILYRNTGLAYPPWLNKILGYKNPNNNVRDRRID